MNRCLNPEEVELLQPAAALLTTHLQVLEEHLFRYKVVHYECIEGLSEGRAGAAVVPSAAV